MQNLNLRTNSKLEYNKKIPQLYPTELLDFKPRSYCIELCLLLF